MLRRLTSLGQVLLVLTFFTGASCLEADLDDVDTEADDGFVLGVGLEELGTDVATCTAASPGTDFVATTKVLNLAVLSDVDAVLSVVGGKLRVNGRQCKTVAINADPSATPPIVGAPSIDLTSANVTKINIAVQGTSKLIFDLLPGSFGNIFAAGGIAVTAATDGMSIGVRGSATANAFKMAQVGSGAAGPYYLELSGDMRADVKVNGTPAAVSFALGDGADRFSAQGQLLTTTAFGAAEPTTDVSAVPLAVFGGAGADALKGGLGNDTLDGGDGNDVFTTSAGSVNDGGDVYIGGAGIDTINYGDRTTALAVSIAPIYDNAWIEGVDLLDFVVPANSVLNYQVGTDPPAAITFPATETRGANAILRFLTPNVSIEDGTVSGGLVGAAAGTNDRGHIFIQKMGAVGAVNVTAGGTGLFNVTESNDGVTERTTDPDDGQAGERDDVRADVENITGGSGNDTLSGSGLSNTIIGGAGADDINGGIGGETCTADADVLNGGEGNDVFDMGSGFNCGDAVDGGPGRDTVSYERRSDPLAITINGGADDGQALERDNVKIGIEVVLGGEAGDVITGGAAPEELHGGPGVDVITGGAGADTITGGPGADKLLGGVGSDVFDEKDSVDTAFVTPWLASLSSESDIINGGADFDTADYGRSSETPMVVSLCSATANTTSAGVCTGPRDAPNNDTADGDDISNCERFIGGAGSDTISGSAANDLLEGGAGDDLIEGGSGNDTLSGGDGDDALDGGGISAAGQNRLSGGNGSADRCTVGAAGTADATCEL